MDNVSGSTSNIDPIVERQKWISFASKLLTLCVEIMKASEVRTTEKGFAEPKILALALLCRTYMTLRGVIAVAKEGLAVEARTLARSCYENMFLVTGLAEKEMRLLRQCMTTSEEAFAREVSLCWRTSTTSILFEPRWPSNFAVRLRALKDRRPNAKLLNPKETASDSVIKPAYLFYSQLSADAAHPSIFALKRHLIRFAENGEQVWGLDIQPTERGSEVAETVNIACNAVLGTCVGVNQILEGTTASTLLHQLFTEYGTMAEGSLRLVRHQTAT